MLMNLQIYKKFILMMIEKFNVKSILTKVKQMDIDISNITFLNRDQKNNIQRYTLILQ
jgi:hypothetical protein